jgi:selenophosphate synthetase-related protein
VTDLARLVASIRSAPAVQAKRELALIRRLAAPPDGDDAAALPYADGFLIMCGEAIAPAFARADPHAAGAAAVVTNVADVRAMGGRPLGLVDTVISPDRAHAEAVLDGIAWAAELHGVDVVGGHLTIGHDAAISAACTGFATHPLRARDARPGDVLLVAFSLDGEYRDGTLFFSSLRARSAEQLRDDGEALVEVAASGAAHAARDVSMPGVAGSLLQLLETAGCGARLDVDEIPRPPGVPLERWLLTFPSFGFVVAVAPERAAAAAEPFLRRGLACAACGRLDDTRAATLAASGETAQLWDLAAEPFTHLGPARST